jgi:hypothetical protein
MPTYINVNGVWKQCNPYVNVNGTWKSAVPYVNGSSTWKVAGGLQFSYSPVNFTIPSYDNGAAGGEVNANIVENNNYYFIISSQLSGTNYTFNFYRITKSNGAQTSIASSSTYVDYVGHAVSLSTLVKKDENEIICYYLNKCYKSTDGGASFTQYSLTGLPIDATDPIKEAIYFNGEYLVAVSNGIFTSSDGYTFSACTYSMGYSSCNVGLTIFDGHVNAVYSTTGDIVRRRLDKSGWDGVGGNVGSLSDPEFYSPRIYKLSSNNMYIYITSPVHSFSIAHIKRSTDLVNWTDITGSVDFYYNPQTNDAYFGGQSPMYFGGNKYGESSYVHWMSYSNYPGLGYGYLVATDDGINYYLYSDNPYYYGEICPSGSTYTSIGAFFGIDVYWGGTLGTGNKILRSTPQVTTLYTITS